MSRSLFSPSWYRVARLKPRLRGHSEIHRHFYRGEKWYVVEDHITGRFYRFTPVVYYVIGLMNGERTVQDLWEKAAEKYGDDAPTQDELIRILSQLHVADMLISDVSPDTAELLRRGIKTAVMKRRSVLRSPLFLKIPLFDPERFLDRTSWLFRYLFSIGGLLLWLLVVGWAVALAGLHWSALTENITDRVLSAGNLFILWLVYPVVKSFHELGHGYAVKRWGGEVHEIGIMLLVFMPIPYVDATASSAFREKWQRALVGAVGIMVELFLAAVAMIVWTSIEPGMFRSIMYNVILIGGISTVLFNGNPLLRYDGYYILSDLADIPNLAQRGINYMQYILKKYLLGAKKIETPYTGPGEKLWLAGYTITSFLYRIVIYAGIILFVAGKFFVIGVVLALWACFGMFLLPFFKGMRFLFGSPQLADNRGRAVVVTVVVLALVTGGLFVLPLPSFTITEGVVRTSEESMVRARTQGFVAKIHVPSGSLVQKGQPLVACENHEIEATIQMYSAKVRELENRYGRALSQDRVTADIVREELDSARARLARAEEEFNDLRISSPGKGRWILPREDDSMRRFLRKGQLLGFVVDTEKPMIQVVVPQTEAALIRNHTREVELRYAERLERTLSGVIIRETPAAVETLPSITLSVAGGGPIFLDPSEPGGLKTFEKFFLFDIELTEPLDQLYVGGRAHVRFRHDDEPLGFQWYKKIRQMLLKRFNV